MHLAWRWFTGLGLDQEIPHHSTFSKNRHGRFHEANVFEPLFAQIVRQCMEVGLVQGKERILGSGRCDAQRTLPRAQPTSLR